MADCIEALITADLKTALETVTTGGGYNTECGTVDEMRTRFKMPSDTNYTLIQKVPKDLDGDYQHTEDSTYRYNVFFFTPFDDSDLSTDPMQYVFRNVIADFQKAIMADRTRGGSAQNTIVESSGIGTFITELGEAMPCVFMTIAVQSLTDADDPYQLG